MKVSSAQPARWSASTLATRLCLVAMAASMLGCRNNASQRDAYIRDLRMQEDQIYELQDYMTEYQELLRQQRKENHRLRQRLEKQSTGADGDDAQQDDDERSLLDRAVPIDSSNSGDTQLPEIDLGEPDLPEIDLGEPLPSGGAEELPAQPRDDLSHTTVDGQTQLASATVFTPPPRPTALADSCAIYAEQMPLEPNGEGEPSAIGLMAIVEPLTADGAAGYFIGEASLMLVDPLASDEEWELARWDYTPEEVEAAWRDHSRRVLDLPLAVPAATPRGRPLELWVRMMAAEGDRKILCSTAVTLIEPVAMIGAVVSGGQSSTDPDAQISSGWAAADQMKASKQEVAKTEPASWQAATTLPPPAVARAEAKERGGEQTTTAQRAPDWSPFRK